MAAQRLGVVPVEFAGGDVREILLVAPGGIVLQVEVYVLRQRSGGEGEAVAAGVLCGRGITADAVVVGHAVIAGPGLLVLLVVYAVGVALGCTAILLRYPLLHLYIKGDEAMKYGCIRIIVINTAYFLCGIMDVTVGSLRGIGYSLIPMFVSLLGVCGFRVAWIFTYFQSHKTMNVLFLSYPISWIVTFLAQITVYLLWMRKNRNAIMSRE